MQISDKVKVRNLLILLTDTSGHRRKKEEKSTIASTNFTLIFGPTRDKDLFHFLVYFSTAASTFFTFSSSSTASDNRKASLGQSPLHPLPQTHE